MEVNELIAFKMDVTDILHWTNEIERLLPGTEPEKIAFLIDCYKKEDLFWDKSKGIQNIFSGLKQIKKLENGEFKVLKAIW